jgi:hypothetical protein
VAIMHTISTNSPKCSWGCFFVTLSAACVLRASAPRDAVSVITYCSCLELLNFSVQSSYAKELPLMICGELVHEDDNDEWHSDPRYVG